MSVVTLDVGGSMGNPAVLRAAEACAARHLATLRFNFRGVGASTGKHDDGRGEQDDVARRRRCTRSGRPFRGSRSP